MHSAFKSITVAYLVAGSVFAVVGWIALTQARDENRALAARLQSAKPQEETKLSNGQADSEEIARLKRENSEILSLRNEVNQLRSLKAELEKLRAENQQLRQIIDSERDSNQAQWTSWFSSVRTNGLTPDNISSLAQALTNEAVSVRVEAAKVLRQIGIQRLMNTNLTVQEESDLRSEARIVVPGLVAALKDSDTFVRANAAITLGFLGEDSQTVVPALIQCLNDEQWRVAGSAAKALGRLKGNASSALPALLRAAQNTDENIRENAINAVKNIDPGAARNAGF